MTQALLTDEEMLAALKAGDSTPSGTEEKAPEPAPPPPAAEDSLKAALAPFQEQLAKLQAQVGYATRTRQEIPPGVVEAITGLQAQVAGIAQSQEELRLRDMTDAERADYYAEQLVRARTVPPPVKAEPEAAAGQLDGRGIEYFDKELAPQLEDIGASHGRSAEEVKAYFEKSQVWPIKDAQGKITGYDWPRYTVEFSKEMAKRSSDADTARTTAAANGDGKKPGSIIGKSIDPMDPTQDYHTMLSAAMRSGAI